MSTVAIIQARMSSERLPGKVLRPLAGRPVLEWVVRAARMARRVEVVVVATSIDRSDDPIAEYAEGRDFHLTRGSLEDVVGRFAQAADETGAETVVRLTADCPLLDPAVIDMTVAAFDPRRVDYLSTTLERSLPRGLDVEVLSRAALSKVASEARGEDREHVTSYLYREPGRARLAGLVFRPRGEDFRVTLDTEDDARVIEAVVDALGDRPPSYAEIIEFLRAHADIARQNAHVEQKKLSDR